MDNIFDLSKSEFKEAVGAKNSEELTQFIHDMNPNQRKYFLDNLENDYVHTTYKRVFAWSENCFTSCGL